jgi:hypothetical protein
MEIQILYLRVNIFNLCNLGSNYLYATKKQLYFINFGLSSLGGPTLARATFMWVILKKDLWRVPFKCLIPQLGERRTPKPTEIQGNASFHFSPSPCRVWCPNRWFRNPASHCKQLAKTSRPCFKPLSSTWNTDELRKQTVRSVQD